jgi:hypothetical protein
MKEYVVQSGRLKIAIVADCPREAALAAVACWQDMQHDPPSGIYGSMKPELVVHRRGRRVVRHFSAVRMLARLRGQSVSATWKQLLSGQVASPNESSAIAALACMQRQRLEAASQ